MNGYDDMACTTTTTTNTPTREQREENGLKLSLTDKPIVEIIKEAIHPKAPDDAFFICNLGQLVRKYEEWTTQLPRVTPYYAVKCNDNELVLETLAALGTGFDCASKAEMGKVINIGVAPSRIIYANPAKMASHILAASAMEIKTTTFDNAMELHKLKKLHPDARLLIRIRCDAVKAQCQLGMKFGVLPEEAPKLLNIAKEMEANVVGVCFHVGSGAQDNAVYGQAIAKAAWLFDIGRKLGFEMNMLDIGGGFPGNTGTSIADIARVVNGALDEYFPEGCGVDIIAEPGRFFVASAFTLVTQVHSLREIEDAGADGGKRFMYYINDGVYGSMNCVLYDHAVVTPRPLKLAGADGGFGPALGSGGNNNNNGQLYDSSVWGPTCDGLDCVCSNVLLPEMTVGEFIYFNDTGAYTIVAAGTFNGFPIPSIQYVATLDTWLTIKELRGGKNLFVDNVPVFTKAAVGCNRDAVGWGMEDMLHPQINSTFSAY